MATETAHSKTTPADDPRGARLAILTAARQLHRRDGATAITFQSVAKEAGVGVDAVAAHFRDAKEILLALAADDLSLVARAMNEDGKDAPDASSAPAAVPAAPPQPVTLRKKPVLPGALEQVMKDVAPDNGKEVITGAMARLERRMQVLEKAFTDAADRQERTARERGETLTSVEQSITAMFSRMEATEKQTASIVGGLHSGVSHIVSRLSALEEAAAHPPASSAAPTADMPLGLPHPLNTIQPEDPLDFGALPSLGSMVTQDAPAKEPVESAPEKETYLANARRAALAAAESENAMRASLDQRRSLRGVRTKFLLFACLAPVAVLGAAILVLNRHAVTAEPVLVSQAAMPAAAPAPAAAPIADASPQDAPAVVAAADPAPLAAPPPPPDVVVEQPATPAPVKPASQKTLATLTGEAEAGNVSSMRDIGLKYLSGDGVGVNEPEAARWLMRAAYKGEPVAEYWLATLYARGRGVPADAFQANHWYEAAAKQGSRRAMHSLAVANFEGWGMEKQNLEEAARWFAAAAELGLADSQFNLAVLYERGSGVPQSLTDAYKWYALAAAQGDKEAENRLKILAGQMKPADLASAQGAVAAFKPKAMDEAANVATDPSYLPPQPPG